MENINKYDDNDSLDEFDAWSLGVTGALLEGWNDDGLWSKRWLLFIDRISSWADQLFSDVPSKYDD